MWDCIIIGINEQEFDSNAKFQEKLKERSGSYEEVLTNSIYIEGKYYTSIELMNLVLRENTTIDWNLNVFETPSLGVYYLTNFLRRRGLKVAFINHYNTGKEKLFSLMKEGVRSIAITTTFYVTDKPIIEIVQDIKEVDEFTKIIVGGPRIYDIYITQPTEKRNMLFNIIGADYYIINSQGEGALFELVSTIKSKENLSNTTIPNIISMKDGELSECIYVNESNSLDENIIDWDLFERSEFNSVVYMRTTRGCRYSCAYCTYPQFAGNYECSQFASIEHEMNQLKLKDVKYIIFVDDSFNIPTDRFKRICEMMIRNQYHFKWLSFFRCVNVSEELVWLMRESGCIGVYLGIESLNKSILNNMRKADINYIACRELFVKYDILTLGSFIVGFPGETEETIKETVRIFNEYPTTFYNPQLYYHSEMAPINQQADIFKIKKKGYEWSHISMNWKEAVYWKNYMIQNVKQSILLPLNSSGIWALPYLFECGITLDFFMKYSRIVSDIIKENTINGTSQTKEDIFRRFKGINMEVEYGKLAY